MTADRDLGRWRATVSQHLQLFREFGVDGLSRDPVWRRREAEVGFALTAPTDNVCMTPTDSPSLTPHVSRCSSSSLRRNEHSPAREPVCITRIVSSLSLDRSAVRLCGQRSNTRRSCFRSSGTGAGFLTSPTDRCSACSRIRRRRSSPGRRMAAGSRSTAAAPVSGAFTYCRAVDVRAPEPRAHRGDRVGAWVRARLPVKMTRSHDE